MTLDLARWQFAITTVYHFLFVPLTIGLSLLVAGIQTAWVRTGNERIHDLSTSFEADVPETSTRVMVLYRISNAFTSRDVSSTRITSNGFAGESAARSSC